MARGNRRRGTRPSRATEIAEVEPEISARMGATTLVAKRQEWSGPLPPPQALQAFEDIAPGTAAKIIDEFQAEAAHRRQQERRQFWLVGTETLVGQFSAIVFALGALGVAGYAAYMGAQWIGAIVGGGVIVGGIIALRTGRNGNGPTKKN